MLLIGPYHSCPLLCFNFNLKCRRVYSTRFTSDFYLSRELYQLYQKTENQCLSRTNKENIILWRKGFIPVIWKGNECHLKSTRLLNYYIVSLAIVTETLYIYRNLLGFETFPSIILPTTLGGRQINYHYFQFSEPMWVKRSYITFPYMHTLKMAQCRLEPWFSSYNSLSTTPWSASGLC